MAYQRFKPEFNQSIADSVIKYYSDISLLPEFCFDNGLNYDDVLTQNTEYVYNNSLGSILQFTPINDETNEGIDIIRTGYISNNQINESQFNTDNVVFGQTLLDYCQLKYGTLERLLKLSLDNGFYLDSEIQQGLELSYDKELKNKKITDFYLKNNIIPINFEENSEVIAGMLFTDGVQIQFTDGTDINFLT